MRGRYYKILLLMLVLTLLTVGVMQSVTITRSVAPSTPQIDPGLRSLRVMDQETSRGRVETWRLALKA